MKHCTKYTVSTEMGMLLLHKIYVEVVAQTMSMLGCVSTTWNVCSSSINNAL